MGVVAGLALRAQAHPGARVVFVNLGDRNRQLLVTLGLARFVDLHGPGETPEDLRPALSAPNPEPSAAPGAGGLAETMLKAHEDLVRIDPENLNRFRDVLEFLHRDVERGAPGGGTP